DPLLVAEEELLDHVGLVAEAEDEVLVPEVGVVLHQVPEDRPVADLDHRLGDLAGVLTQARAQPAAEQDHLHVRSSLPVRCGGSHRRSAAPSSARAASRTTPNGSPARSATSSMVCCPSAWFMTH